VGKPPREKFLLLQVSHCVDVLFMAAELKFIISYNHFVLSSWHFAKIKHTPKMCYVNKHERRNVLSL
jgi:hypothetical protein